MTVEIWKPIKGYRNLYEISSLGNVRRLSGVVPRKDRGFTYVEGRILTLHEDAHGYLAATLYKMGNSKQYRVHRLVSEAFVKGKTKEKNIVNHIDNNRKNNCIENLEWVTPSENAIHGMQFRKKKNKKLQRKTKIPKGTKEKWLPVPDYEGYYIASNLGRVKRLETRFIGRNGKLQVTKERFLTSYLFKDSRFVVKLTKNGKGKIFYLHRLIAELFSPNPDNKPFVRHKDECIDNNIVFNLEWCDPSELYHNKFVSNSVVMKLKVDIEKEIWKEIKGYEGYYQVSNLGRVRSCDRTIIDKKGRKRFYKGRILTAKIRGVYYYVSLNKNCKLKYFPIHRLVATAFIFNDDLENKIFVNHINANMLDNRVENLEWVTPKENSEHMSSLDRGAVKPIQQFDLKGDFIKEYPSAIRAAKENNFVYGVILAAVANDNRYAYNFLWKWSDDDAPLVLYKDAREKRVLRYTLDGDYIQTFDSLAKATEHMRNNGYPNAKAANISKACTGIRNYSYDSQWRHEGDKTPLKKLKPRVKRIVQLSMEGEYMSTYNAITDAEIHLGIKLNFSGISKCCNRRQNHAHGFKWMFEEDYKKAFK